MPDLSVPCAVAVGNRPHVFFVGRGSDSRAPGGFVADASDRFLYCDFFAPPWQWESQGSPESSALPPRMLGRPSAIVDPGPPTRIFVFVVREDNNLCAHIWSDDARRWNWEIIGNPGVDIRASPVEGLFTVVNGTVTPHVFVVGADHNLHAANPSGLGTWRWRSHGMPAGTMNPSSGAFSMSATLYQRRPYVFVPRQMGSRLVLFARFIDLSGEWTWAPTVTRADGTPVGPELGSVESVDPIRYVSAISYRGGDGIERILVFCAGQGSYRLWICYWNGATWAWRD